MKIVYLVMRAIRRKLISSGWCWFTCWLGGQTFKLQESTLLFQCCPTALKMGTAARNRYWKTQGLYGSTPQRPGAQARSFSNEWQWGENSCRSSVSKASGQ